MVPVPSFTTTRAGVIFACLAYFKELFMLEQPLFTEFKYLAMLGSYRFFKIGGRQSLLYKDKGENCPKMAVFGQYFSNFLLLMPLNCINLKRSISFSDNRRFRPSKC